MKKIGITEWALPGEGIFAIELAFKAGLKGIQIGSGSYATGFKIGQKEIQELYMENSLKYGVEILSIALNDLNVHGFNKGRETEHGKIAYKNIELTIEAAKNMQIKSIMIPSFLDNDILSENDYLFSAEALRYACSLAAEDNIEVLSETTLLPDEQKKLFSMVNMPNIKLIYDTQNYKLFKDYDQMEILKGSNDVMTQKQVHVKDGIDVISSCLLGEGTCKVFEQLDYLQGNNYNGWLILENYYSQLPLRKQSENYMDILKKDLSILTEYLTKG